MTVGYLFLYVLTIVNPLLAIFCQWTLHVGDSRYLVAAEMLLGLVIGF